MDRFRKPRARAIAIVACALLFASWYPLTAHATLDARANLTVRRVPVGSPTPELVFQNETRDLDATGSFAGTSLSPNLTYVAPASGARVRYGSITAFAQLEANHPGDWNYYGNGLGDGRFTDLFRVTAPGATGPATMTLRATARAAFDYGPQGSTDTTNFTATGSASFDLFVNGQARVQDRYTTRYWADINGNVPARMSVDVASLNGSFSQLVHDPALAGTGRTVIQHFDIDVPIQFGGLVTVDARLTVPATASACCSPGDGVDSRVNASFVWEGITRVVRGDGTPVTGFQALGTATGFDYAQAAVVPEPGAAVMLMAGLFPVWLVARRHAQRRQATASAT